MPELRKPYLLYLGDARLASEAKTAFGLRDWCPTDVVGEWSRPSATVSLGLPRLSPAEAAAMGAGSLLIGVAPIGGQIPEQWLPDLTAALEAGLDIVSGMHTRLTSFPALVEAASRQKVTLHDIRHSDEKFPAGSGAKRSGIRVATVGTDCALGKKYTALALTNALKARGFNATFRATGQTGIMIAGSGVAIDAVIADFIAGAAETLSPANDPDHWDVIEGQGSLYHPAYAGVTLGLLHGSQPDWLVLCHDPSRKEIESRPGFVIPPLAEAAEHYLKSARLTNRNVRLGGASINSSSLSDEAWSAYREQVSRELGVPVADPMRGGVDAIVSRLVGVD